MRPQRRVMARHRMLKTGSIEFSETAIECTVRNMSEAGAALEVVSPIYIPDRFTLFIQSEQSKLTCRIVWRTGKRMGVAFRWGRYPTIHWWSPRPTVHNAAQLHHWYLHFSTAVQAEEFGCLGASAERKYIRPSLSPTPSIESAAMVREGFAKQWNGRKKISLGEVRQWTFAGCSFIARITSAAMTSRSAPSMAPITSGYPISSP
jgi:hypothetical protein